MKPGSDDPGDSGGQTEFCRIVGAERLRMVTLCTVRPAVATRNEGHRESRCPRRPKRRLLVSAPGKKSAIEWEPRDRPSVPRHGQLTATVRPILLTTDLKSDHHACRFKFGLEQGAKEFVDWC